MKKSIIYCKIFNLKLNPSSRLILQYYTKVNERTNIAVNFFVFLNFC
jgi:hypothetical protein